jgi:hypothetical protein
VLSGNDLGGRPRRGQPRWGQSRDPVAIHLSLLEFPAHATTGGVFVRGQPENLMREPLGKPPRIRLDRNKSSRELHRQIVDTNVLLRSVQPNQPLCSQATRAVSKLSDKKPCSSVHKTSPNSATSQRGPPS